MHTTTTSPTGHHTPDRIVALDHLEHAVDHLADVVDQILASHDEQVAAFVEQVLSIFDRLLQKTRSQKKNTSG